MKEKLKGTWNHHYLRFKAHNTKGASNHKVTDEYNDLLFYFLHDKQIQGHQIEFDDMQTYAAQLFTKAERIIEVGGDVETRFSQDALKRAISNMELMCTVVTHDDTGVEYNIPRFVAFGMINCRQLADPEIDTLERALKTPIEDSIITFQIFNVIQGKRRTKADETTLYPVAVNLVNKAVCELVGDTDKYQFEYKLLQRLKDYWIHTSI
ncbi:hypothetical protein [Neptuniibacter sp. QD37_11]|uniref:hypothetical protein n=1 Tax=Neptuniibacter sp. QD37_11 TaxID=3398209 RepID=UPI0039F4C767